MLETAGKSLHHSCWSELTRQGVSLPLDRYSYGRRLLGIGPDALNIRSFTCQHRAGVRLYTSSYDFAESCVFDKQSLPLGFLFWLWLPIGQTMFLPKLHMQFAEFLQHNYLIHLSILYPTTCVSSWYGHKIMDCFLLSNTELDPTVADRTPMLPRSSKIGSRMLT